MTSTIPGLYVDYCQSLWANWLSDSLAVPDSLVDRFQLAHAPEPYLQFGKGSRPLYLLFTNPGNGMDHQRRDRIVAGRSCVTATMTYAQVSRSFANYYETNLEGAAKIRIDAMKQLAALAGFDHSVQFESIPFHSANLPGKRKLPDLIDQTSILSDYARVLPGALQSGPLVALSAVGSNADIGVDLIRKSPWLAWQAARMGMDLDEARTEPLVEKNNKTTCGFVYQQEEWTKGFVLMMGGNHFPARRSLERLAEFFNSPSLDTTPT